VHKRRLEIRFVNKLTGRAISVVGDRTDIVDAGVKNAQLRILLSDVNFFFLVDVTQEVK